MEDALLIGRCVNPHILEEDNLTTKTIPVHYSYMLLSSANRKIRNLLKLY